MSNYSPQIRQLLVDVDVAFTALEDVRPDVVAAYHALQTRLRRPLPGARRYGAPVGVLIEAPDLARIRQSDPLHHRITLGRKAACLLDRIARLCDDYEEGRP